MTLYAAPTTSARRLCPCRCTRSRARVDVYSLPDTAWIAHGRIARINLHTHVTVHGCSRGKRGEGGSCGEEAEWNTDALPRNRTRRVGERWGENDLDVARIVLAG